MEGQSFEIYAGDTKPIIIEVEVEVGAPALAQAQEIEWGLALSPVHEPFLKKTQTAGQITVVAEEDEIIFTLDAEDTRDLVPGDPPGRVRAYYHQARVTDEEGKPQTVASGWVTVKSSILNQGEE